MTSCGKSSLSLPIVPLRERRSAGEFLHGPRCTGIDKWHYRLEQTTNGDFLICPHPRYGGLHLATGGSLHGWKFLPLLGEFVVDSITGRLEANLVEKWSWESKANAKLNKYGFMTPGKQRELGDITRRSSPHSRL